MVLDFPNFCCLTTWKYIHNKQTKCESNRKKKILWNSHFIDRISCTTDVMKNKTFAIGKNFLPLKLIFYCFSFTIHSFSLTHSHSPYQITLFTFLFFLLSKWPKSRMNFFFSGLIFSCSNIKNVWLFATLITHHLTRFRLLYTNIVEVTIRGWYWIVYCWNVWHQASFFHFIFCLHLQFQYIWETVKRLKSRGGKINSR